MGYNLSKVETKQDWQAYHAIRRKALFEEFGNFSYDENYPDEYLPDNYPLLFTLNSAAIGTTRLDKLEQGLGVVRLVAIVQAERGKGHGRQLAAHTELFAQTLGLKTLYVNAAPEAVGYYRKLGWTRYNWNPAELRGIAANCVQYKKGYLMLIDSHCHLDYEPLRDQLPDVLAQAKASGVDAMLSISTKLSAFDNLLKIAEANPMVYCSIGNHPHNASTEPMWPDDQFLAAAQHPKVIGIGEAGLDYYYDYAPKDIQEQIFRKHIFFARETKLPLIIHTRDADEDTETILRDEMKKGAFPFLLHCFTAGQKLAEAGIEMGGYVSFSGILTYKTADNIRAVAKMLPADRILVETDSPYLAPIPHRGKSNQPAFVRHTAEKLAEVRGVPLPEIARQTTENFYRLFWKAKP